MRIIGHGIDLVECSRIGEIAARHGDRFLDRIYTAAERAAIARLREPLPHMAGRFAAKEAILKVLGTGWRGPIAWTDIEILNDSYGRPLVSLSGACRQIAEARGIDEIQLSITHTAAYAAASAIGVSNADA